MFIDARTLAKGHQAEADLCIIGAGAAGITLARELANTSSRIVVLESGGLQPSDEVQRLAEGEIAGQPYRPLVITRLRGFGGSTNHWAGACRPLDAIDFEQRDWVPHSGWPITRVALDPFYIRAHEICGLGPYRYDPANWQSPAAPPLPFSGSSVQTSFFQFSNKRRFGEIYRAELERAPNIDFYLNATVLELQTAAQPNAVRSVQAGTLNGSRFSVSARYVVIACGGIENARLLLLSNSIQKAGLGNQHDLVGRYFMEHPHVHSGIFLPAEKRPPLGLYREQDIRGTMVKAALTIGEERMRQERLLGFSVTLTPYELAGAESIDYLKERIAAGEVPPKHTLWHLKRIFGDAGELMRDAYRNMTGSEDPRSGTFRLHVRAEQSPNPESRVVLSTERDALAQPKGKLIWRLTALDKHSMRRSEEIIAQALGESGLGRLKIELDPSDDVWPPELAGGAHHMGTTRMHIDKHQGVVDDNCKMHSVANLYVAGSSVFPTVGFSNPTLTIVAMTLRLADHLKGVLKRR